MSYVFGSGFDSFDQLMHLLLETTKKLHSVCWKIYYFMTLLIDLNYFDILFMVYGFY